MPTARVTPSRSANSSARFRNFSCVPRPMCSCSTFSKGRQQRLLIVLGQGLVGHREQAVVLLLDVFPQQAHVTLGMIDELGDRFAVTSGGPLDCFRHARICVRPCSCSESITPVGPPWRGNPLASIAGKRWVSSLPWWQRSAKLRKKSSACSAEVLSNRPSVAQFLRYCFQAIEHLLDNAMLATKDFGRFHHRLLEKCLFVCST